MRKPAAAEVVAVVYDSPVPDRAPAPVNPGERLGAAADRRRRLRGARTWGVVA